MKANNILTSYSTIGRIISVLCIFAVCSGSGCEKVDYIVRADWIFVNSTSHKIEIESQNYWPDFVLMPEESYTYKESGLGPNNMQAEDYRTPWYGTIVTMIVDDVYTHTLNEEERGREGEGCTVASNYTSKKLGNNYWEFTYTFTNKDLELMTEEQP